MIDSTKLFHQNEDYKTTNGNIFKANSPEEITSNYQRLLVTVGKWNADLYLKIIEELSGNKLATTPVNDNQVFRNVSKKNPCIQFDGRGRQDEVKHVGFSCGKCNKLQQPIIVPKHKTYQKREESHVDMKLDTAIEPNTKRNSDILETNSLEINLSPEVNRRQMSKRPLMDDCINNYLDEVRNKKKSNLKNCFSIDITKEPEKDEDQIKALFSVRSIYQSLEGNLNEELGLLTATLEDEVIPVDQLKAGFLGSREVINELEEKYSGSRWRKGFDINEIERDTNDDSTDISDIHSEQPFSVGSDYSNESEIYEYKYGTKMSRIPYCDEVHQLKNYLFDKITLKWEKLIKKNIPQMSSLEATTPCCRSLYSQLLSRCEDPFYGKTFVELGLPIYRKTFVPFKIRGKEKLDKLATLNEHKRHVSESRKGEANITLKANKQPTYEPTKYLDKTQRERLQNIIKATKRKFQEGTHGWNKKDIFDQYVNLRPIISTKRPTQNLKNRLGKKTSRCLVRAAPSSTSHPTGQLL